MMWQCPKCGWWIKFKHYGKCRCPECFTLVNITEKGKVKLIPVGHGVKEDLVLIWNQILNKDTCDNFISHKVIDTCIVSRFLQDSGFIPEDQSNKVGALCEYYGLGPYELHNALEDATAHINIYQKQRDTIDAL